MRYGEVGAGQGSLGGGCPGVGGGLMLDSSRARNCQGFDPNYEEISKYFAINLLPFQYRDLTHLAG